MALGRNTEVFSQKWQTRLAPATLNTMPCQVEFYDPELSEAVFDYSTGTWSEGEVKRLWSGMARIQPIRGTSSVNNNANDTTVQSVLVSIPIFDGRDLDLRTRDRGRVLSAPLMPVLKNYVYVAQEIIDSGNAIERTFVFRVDQERVENG